nr:hypothetical protein [Tanacetum cinerariifolium]
AFLGKDDHRRVAATVIGYVISWRRVHRWCFSFKIILRYAVLVEFHKENKGVELKQVSKRERHDSLCGL